MCLQVALRQTVYGAIPVVVQFYELWVEVMHDFSHQDCKQRAMVAAKSTNLRACCKVWGMLCVPPSEKSLAMLRFGLDNGISSTCMPSGSVAAEARPKERDSLDKMLPKCTGHSVRLQIHSWPVWPACLINTGMFA